MINNKIKIPWYRRTVQGIQELDDMGNNPISFVLPRLPKPRGRGRLKPQPERERVRSPVRSPVTSPVTSPVNSPVNSPVTSPDAGGKPFDIPVQNPPIPIPYPFPKRDPDKNPYREPTGQPAFIDTPVPEWATNPNYDWNNINTPNRVPVLNSIPYPEKNAFQKSIETLIKPALYLFLSKEALNQYTKVNVTDPIYNKMLSDPVLGTVLREANKANMDAEILGTILANFDWQNGDIKTLEKSLVTGVGVAGATRLMIFIVGRKVAFRM